MMRMKYMQCGVMLYHIIKQTSIILYVYDTSDHHYREAVAGDPKNSTSKLHYVRFLRMHRPTQVPLGDDMMLLFLLFAEPNDDYDAEVLHQSC